MKRFVVCGYDHNLILAKAEAITATSRALVVCMTVGVRAWDYPTVIVLTENEARKIGRCGETTRRKR